MVERLLITGATGFVGTYLVSRAETLGIPVLQGVRQEYASGQTEYLVTRDIGPDTVWHLEDRGLDSVVHLAARVHVMEESEPNPLKAFRRVNLYGTTALAEAAARAGVRRFVYLSSIKVNGEQTFGEPFTEAVSPDPHDPYAISKWEAEQALWEISERTGMEVVVIRPPLVYGAGCRGNLQKLMGWVDRGVPLPFGRVENRRSLIGLANLVDFILLCIQHPQAAGEVFLISDGNDLSTPQLVRTIARQMGRSPRLIPMPPPFLSATLHMLGKESMAQRLLGSLQIDSSKARQKLGWMPACSVEEEMRRMVMSYRLANEKKA